MARFLLVLLALLLARLAWSSARLLFASRRRAPAPGVGGKGRAPEFRGAVVRCDECDLHVPGDRAIVAGERSYCSARCRDAARG